MKAIAAFFVCLMATACLAQEDMTNSELCEDLGTSPGQSLNYCRRDQEQCCTNAYFKNRVEAISQMITNEIRGELDIQIDDGISVVLNRMEKYLRQTFVPRFSRRFCSSLLTTQQCTAAIEGARQGLLNNLYINDDEETDTSIMRDKDSGYGPHIAINEYYHDVMRAIVNRYLSKYNQSVITEKQFLCMFQSSQMERPDEIRYLEMNLTQVRKSITALRRLRFHINTTTVPYILNIRPTNSCIHSFINVRCEACYEEIPDLCRGACNALVYGCLAPYRDGLEAQFNLLWSIIGQLVELTNEALPILISSLPDTYSYNISDSAAVQQAAQRCNISLSDNPTNSGGTSGGNSNGTSDGNSGGTSDGNSGGTAGSSSDSPTNDNTDDDDGVNRLPMAVDEVARRLIDSGAFNDTEPKTCERYENNNCWNGSANVTVNNINFSARSIQGQRNNPLATYNVTQLQDMAASFDTFVTNFLQTEYFMDVTPEGLVLPFNTTRNDTNGIDGFNSSAGTVRVGYALLLVLLILGLLML